MKKTKEKKHRAYDEWLIESLEDPEEARLYLQAAFDEYKVDNDLDVLLQAIWAYAKAQGVSDLAKKSKINRQNLYRVFTGERNPRWKTMQSIIKGVGFELSFQPLADTRTSKR
jgi:probable addiction module antidote protein